ncbi:hypothetical protein V494_01542 [Pseudogymnoascus sp. VKM F-4513 (FW-928)]|nr:hypothetical protein V494_01542 [Pseudogymnoascus sp. VKM F-4513 (FW-928)]
MAATQWAKSLQGDAIEAESTSPPSPSSDPTTDPTSLEDFDQPLNDPSVVVGLACRVPGAANPSQLWKNIQEKKDIQKKMPADRFNVDTFYHPDGTHKGTTNAKFGYFLDQDIGNFDAGFFNISGNEAEAMDPQQRLLLEVVYEALENAGITLQEISGTNTSVFAGSFTNDYNSMMTKDLEQYPKYMVTGTGNAILSNRISYFYNLHGSSVTIDTACSSSIVCFDLGNKSLQNGESDISIIVGSAIHFDPNIYTIMTDLGMLSTDGRCRAFDEAASGYVRGEGVVAAVLRKKSTALRHGDNIRAVVRASLTNHDGKKNGITLPSSEAQEALIKKTYETNHLDPAETAYFEAHGTGTKAGDPRESRAIGAVFGSKYREPIYVGSVKTNIGHLEGASGLSGIMKAVLALEHKTIPPNMLFNNPSSAIKFADWGIQVPTTSIPWDAPNGIRRASINSFGYGGTNGHVVLEGYYPRENQLKLGGPSLPESLASMVQQRPYLLPLSSHSPRAGKLLTDDLTSYLARFSDTKALDFVYSLSVRRSMHQHRSFAIGSDVPSIVQDMTSPQPIAKWIPSGEKAPRLGFVFTGQGGQWWAMGRQLLLQSPLFKQTMEKCDSILASLPDAPEWTVVEELSRTKEGTRLAETRFSQPICTALQLGILAIFDAWGIHPSAVVGHSSGEMAAAYSAGILSFRNTIIAAYYRGLYMSNGAPGTSPTGSMMAIGLSEQAAIEELKAFEGRIAVAAINSPSNVTVSGDLDAILELKETLTERKVFARQLQVAQAFHSHHMLPLAPPYLKALETCDGFEPKKPKTRMFSSVTARVADYDTMGPSYWCDNMTNAVRFSDALTGILLDEMDEQNVDVLVEIGPHPALKGPSRQTVQALKLEIPYIASLTRDVHDFEGLLQSAGQLFALGYPVNLAAVNSNHFIGEDGHVKAALDAQRLENLPTYSWDHSRYWSETRVIRDHRLRKHRQIILGAPIPGHIPNNPRWRNYLRQSELPWLVDHRIEGKVIFPAAGYISMAVEAITRLDSRPTEIKAIALKDIVVKSALIVSEKETGTEVVVELKPSSTSAKSSSDEWYEFFIYSFDDEGRCSENCRGLISNEAGSPDSIDRIEPFSMFSELQSHSHRRVAPHKYYDHLSDLGLNYGETFRLLNSNVDTGPDFAISTMAWKPQVYEIPEGQESIIHPALLDASFHPIFAAIESIFGRPLDEPYVPTFVRSLKISGLFMSNGTTECTYKVASNTRISGPRIAVTDLRVHSEDENSLMIDIQGLEVTALGNDSDSGSDGRSLFFRTRWLPMFDSLKSKDVKGLSQLVDVFAHQYPNAKILHLTDNLETTNEVLKLLGGTPGVRRRFKSITPWSVESNSSEVFAPLAEKWGSLVEFEEPKEGDYDLVIVSSSTQLKASDMVKYGGVVINSVDIDSQEVSNIFRSPQFTAWRKQDIKVETAKKIAAVISETPSAKTLEVVSAIESSQGSPVIRQTIAQAARLTASCDCLVILTSLDENLLFENAPGKSSDFEAIQKLLTEATCDIVWLTEGATLESSRPEQGLIQGLARTVRTEVEDLRLVVLDVEVGSSALDISRHTLDVVNSPTKEDECSVRNGTVLIPRIGADDSLNSKLPNGVSREATLQKLYQPDRTLALKVCKVGLLETLAFSDNEDIAKPLLDNELEIECKASAINFRDIAASMGIIDDFRLGDECAGIVLRVGKDVDPTEFQVGDRVVALRPGQGAHATVVRNPASWCHKLNSDMPFSIAAALPCILVTAYYSFVDIARLTKGETVLIHAAAGGVGQMAIQVAQMLGANIIATVGSQPKRDLLIEKFGLRDDQIFNSRDDSFVRGVMKVTNGRGVDVALNSLAGKLLHATWKCIAPFGRFIEIGKRDIHENSKIGMDQFRTSVSFASVDLITMFEKNKPLGARMLKECCKLVHEGFIKPPHTISELSYAEAEKGFRLLQMGKHTGKVVLVPGKDDMVPVLPQSYNNAALFRGDKTYLVIGGLGGLGRTLAEFLVRKGAGNLAMFSRSGTSRPEAQDTVDWLRARNVNVKVFSGDVANYETVAKCIKELGSSLAGIFQAAMVLQDAPFEKMTYKQWQTGMSPKVQGTYNLHKATLELGTQLDFFICFSSVSGVLGGLAQANYSAANNYLDALMAHRRSLGLAASTMNCGMIVGVGAVAENAGLQAFMERMGYDGVVEEELFYQIEEAVKGSTGSFISENGTVMHQTVTGVNLKRDDLPCSLKPLFGNIYQNHDFKGTSAQGKDSGKKLSVVLSSTATVEERIVILTDAFIKKIAAVLAVPTDNILPSNRLAAYGLDSIVAVEFRKWFSKVVGVELAVFDILGATSIHSLVVKAAADIVQVSATVEKEAAVGTKTTTAVAAATKEIHASGTGPLSDIARVCRPAEVPMSSFQRRLWFIHNLVQDRSFLNVSAVTAVLGKPDFPSFQLAIREMVKRNDILRTSFYEGDNMAEQNVLSAEAMSIDVDFKDVSTSTHPKAALEAYVASIKEQELDIEEGRVIKFSLVKLDSEIFSFVVVYHHIAFDRGSANSFLEQFTSIYDAIRSATDLSTILAPRVGYSDFTIWHNALLESETLQDSVQFWKNKLSGSSGVSSLLPFAKCIRPEEMDYERAEIASILPLKALHRMKRICTGTGVTPFHFLMAAFRSFLYRYTKEEDLTIQMIDGNRPHPDLQDTIGFFVNMIPVRSTLSGDHQNRFDQVLEQAKMQTLEALQHNKVPFDVIVDSVDVPKNLSVFPLGQVVVNYQMHGTIPTYTTKDFTMSSIESDDVPSACEIALETLEDPELGLKLRLEYSTTLYGSEDMERFMENFMTFLSSAIKDHRQPITEIEMCGPLEMEYQKERFWGTETVADQWSGESVIGKIYKNALRTPEAVAVMTSDGALITYSDLMTKAKKVSAALRNAGAAPGSCVGLFCQPGVDAISGMLGALLNRSGYVALDPNFAPERLSFMVKDSSINIVLLGDGLMDAAIKIGTQTGTQPQLIALAATGGFDIEGMGPPTTNPHDPFFTIYTSGSTGKPKGVVLSQSNTQQMLRTLEHDYNFTPQDRFLHQSSICFDLSIVQIFSALSAGGRVCIATAATRQSPAQLGTFMAAVAISVTYFTPTQFALLLESCPEELRKCQNYRIAYFAGEALPVRVAEAFHELKTPAALYNTWSPSEVVVQTAIHKVTRSDYEGSKTNIPIGFPMANCRHYIVDEKLNLLPLGLVGEIAVGGGQVGQGYINRPQENAKAFVENPFASALDIKHGWTRLFRTGDKGRFLPNGELEFHGRIKGDKQIKLRGFRIDLGEVEQQLFTDAATEGGQGLVDVNVTARPITADLTTTGSGSLTDDRQLVAFLVLKKQMDEKEVQEFINAIHAKIQLHLNSYMLPNGYEVLSALPVTIGGKVDRQNLLKRDLQLIFPSTATESDSETEATNLNAPSADVLHQVICIFRDVLKLGAERDIKPAQSFFELGGQSILVLRLQAKIKRATKVSLPLPVLFKNSTPEAIAALICKKSSSAPATVNAPSKIVEFGEKIDWELETTLPATPKYSVLNGTPKRNRSEQKSLLITGVETFIGLHMISTLLSASDDTTLHIIGCETQLTLEQIQAGLQKYKLDTNWASERLSCRLRMVPGSLSQPRLGLSESDFKELGQNIHAVYHVGSDVSLLKTYVDLKPINIDATLDLIELASLGISLTEIHYLSTWSVPHLQSWSTTTFNPSASPSGITTHESTAEHFTPAPTSEKGYFKARWAAEILLTRAAQRGFAVTIYRPSAVTASTDTGVPEPAGDIIRWMVKQMVDSRCIPETEKNGPGFAIDFIPVNYLTNTLLALASGPTAEIHSAPGIYHIGNPSPLPIRELPSLIGESLNPAIDGEKAEAVSVEEFLRRVGDVLGTERTVGEQLRLAALQDYFSTGHTMFALDRSNTDRALADTKESVSCPPMDAKFLSGMLRGE